MKTIEYRFLDKSAWRPGPWQSEPDKIQWEDAETRLPCLAVRNSISGHWCGYVGVFEGHPSFGKDDDNLDHNYTCHGGITFTGFCVEEDKAHGICHVPDVDESDRVWWFGFDCAHADDFLPAPATQWSRIFPNNEYRSLDYVRDECLLLAAQLYITEQLNLSGK